jgi:tetratricopeptide (TPR) repeat protein
VIELLLQAESALSLGSLDRAEVLYRQVADADPRNAIAVVGLARVAFERSDEVAALTLARRALGIDPEDVAAGQLVQRLELVLGDRGVALSPPAASASETAAADEAPPADPGRRPRLGLGRLLRRRGDRP